MHRTSSCKVSLTISPTQGDESGLGWSGKRVMNDLSKDLHVWWNSMHRRVECSTRLRRPVAAQAGQSLSSLQQIKVDALLIQVTLTSLDTRSIIVLDAEQ